MINQEVEQELEQVEEKDSTNWKAWYIGLVVFLLLQIGVFLWITNHYGA